MPQSLAEKLRAAALESRQHAEEAAADEKAAEAEEQAARERKEAARARREKYSHVEALLESQAAVLDEGLHMSPERSIIGSKMQLDTTGQARNVRIAATKTKSDSKAKRFLLKRGLTDQMIADELKVGRSTVNAWMNGTRSIPPQHSETLRSKHGVPPAIWQKRG